ncbi:hypothetical protein GALL_500130 [mine drainage metagenome]|uniref:Uncharacterized protein n=1 Tax=mine drainage metagenome TaxID=410659 RepID=A0A1J5PSY6_9ZZZZ
MARIRSLVGAARAAHGRGARSRPHPRADRAADVRLDAGHRGGAHDRGGARPGRAGRGVGGGGAPGLTRRHAPPGSRSPRRARRRPAVAAVRGTVTRAGDRGRCLWDLFLAAPARGRPRAHGECGVRLLRRAHRDGGPRHTGPAGCRRPGSVHRRRGDRRRRACGRRGVSRRSCGDRCPRPSGGNLRGDRVDPVACRADRLGHRPGPCRSGRASRLHPGPRTDHRELLGRRLADLSDGRCRAGRDLLGAHRRTRVRQHRRAGRRGSGDPRRCRHTARRG